VDEDDWFEFDARASRRASFGEHSPDKKRKSVSPSSAWISLQSLPLPQFVQPRNNNNLKCRFDYEINVPRKKSPAEQADYAYFSKFLEQKTALLSHPGMRFVWKSRKKYRNPGYTEVS
jgi:hypothetical protein